MINDKNLHQEGGEGSTNVQADTITVYQGLSYSEAKDIALDVFKSNFVKLSENAAELAKARAEELIDRFIVDLQTRDPKSIENMKDPSMQYAVYSAQKEYAKNGDKDLADVLVDILVDRASITERNLKQIVLDESLNVVSKLTNNQLDTLTIAFLIKYSMNVNLGTLIALDKYLKTHIQPFVAGLSKENSLFQHLQYCGCSNVNTMTSTKIETIFLKNYKGLFSKGFTEEEFSQKISQGKNYEKYLIKNLHDKTKQQIRFLNDDLFDAALKKDNVSKKDVSNLKSYFTQTTMKPNEVKEFLISSEDFVRVLTDIWDNSPLKSLTLTSVGIALAQANFRRKTGITIDLGIWIK